MDGTTRRERKKHEVRERLLEAAKQLFAVEDAASVPIERIAEAADVSRATFFNYFPSKGALLDELARRMQARLHRYLEDVRRQEAPLDRALAHWFSLSVATIRRSEALSRVLFARAFAGSEESATRAAEMAEVHRSYGALLRDAAARGEIPEDADVDFLAEMLAGAMTTLLNNWFNDPGYPLEARAEQTARFLAAAMMPRSRPTKRGRTTTEE